MNRSCLHFIQGFNRELGFSSRGFSNSHRLSSPNDFVQFNQPESDATSENPSIATRTKRNFDSRVKIDSDIRAKLNSDSRVKQDSNYRSKRDAQFIQSFQGGSNSQHFDCAEPYGCGNILEVRQAVGSRVTYQAPNFDQNIQSVNFGGQSGRRLIRKRSPQFIQRFEAGSNSQSFNCAGPNGCGNIPAIQQIFGSNIVNQVQVLVLILYI